MIIIPSRGRPKQLARLIEAYEETQASSPVFVCIDENDPSLEEYRNVFNAGLRLPRTWVVNITKPLKHSQHLERFFYYEPDLSYYFVLNDDMEPRTKHWDRILIEAAGRDKVSYGNDMATQRPSMFCIGGDLVRAVGWLAFPGALHWYSDTVWQWLADKTGRLVYRPDVLIPHLHPDFGTAEVDDTHRNRFVKDGVDHGQAYDEAVWKRWHDSGESMRVVERIKERLK